MTRRRKPHDPNKATSDAALAAERKARKLEIERLKAMGASVTLDRGGHVVSAFRSNVFNLLLTRKTITENQYFAAYTLSNTWAIWKGVDGKGEGGGEYVDGGPGCAELVTDRMIEAGKVINGCEARIGVLQQLLPVDRKLIEAFMVASVEEDRPMIWRGIVDRTLGGPIARDAQTRLVVGALESLRCVYEAPRERRAA